MLEVGAREAVDTHSTWINGRRRNPAQVWSPDDENLTVLGWDVPLNKLQSVWESLVYLCLERKTTLRHNSQAYLSKERSCKLPQKPPLWFLHIILINGAVLELPGKFLYSAKVKGHTVRRCTWFGWQPVVFQPLCQGPGQAVHDIL